MKKQLDLKKSDGFKRHALSSGKVATISTYHSSFRLKRINARSIIVTNFGSKTSLAAT